MADCETKANSSSASEVVTPQSLVTEGNVQVALTADKGANAQLTAWKVVDFTKKGDNYMCIVSSVEVKYELDGQSSEVVYVVKLNPCISNPSAEALNDIIFEKEAKFYLNLVPELNCVLKETGQREINFPKCFSASLEKGKEIIFLEDLRSRGYKMFDRTHGMDEAHATLVLTELARLHAASLLLQNKYPGEALGEKYPYLKKDMHYFIANSDVLYSVFKNGLQFAQEILKKVGRCERAVPWIDTLILKLMDIFYEQLNSGEPKVVCHGDCWNNNLLFKYDVAGHPEGVMLLDLQVVRYGPPTPDLTYLIYTSTTGDFRKANLPALLSRYHETLTDIMEAAGQEAPFTQEQLLKDFRDKSLFGAILGMTAVPVLMLECDDAVDSSKDSDEYMEERLAKARAKSMDTLDTNPLLKPRFLSLFDDMMEAGFIP